MQLIFIKNKKIFTIIKKIFLMIKKIFMTITRHKHKKSIHHRVHGLNNLSYKHLDHKVKGEGCDETLSYLYIHIIYIYILYLLYYILILFLYSAKTRVHLHLFPKCPVNKGKEQCEPSFSRVHAALFSYT